MIRLSVLILFLIKHVICNTNNGLRDDDDIQKYINYFKGTLATPSWVKNSKASRFIVLSTRHSGTHYFTNVIRQHQDIIFLSEVCEYGTGLHVRGVSCFDMVQYGLGLFPSKINAIKDFWTRHEDRKDNFKSLGLLIQSYQGWEHEAFQQKLIGMSKHPLLRGNSFSIIILQRLNFITRFMSNDNTKVTAPGEVNYMALSEHAVNKERFAIDHAFKTAVETFDNNEFSWLYVSYERINRDHLVFLKVFQHLGFNNIQLLLDSSKNNGTSVFTVTTTSAVGVDKYHKQYNITVNNGTKHHQALPYKYISNADVVAGFLRKENLTCMLYENCTYTSSYCTDASRCFL